MESFYLTVNSMGRLAPTLLTLIISVYLLSLRGKTIRTYLLAGYFVGLTLFNFGHLYAYTIFAPAGRWGWYLVSAIGFALIFKTRFAYYLPRNAFPKEERIAFWITVVLASAAWIEYVIRSGLSSRFYFESHFYGAPFVSTSVPIVAFLIFAWGMVVLVRQTFHGGGEINRAALGFLGLTLLELLLNGIVLLQRFEVIPEGDDAIAIGMNVLLLLLFFSYALLYLNLSSEPSSFVAKLVGISLVTVMTVISSVGLHQMIQAEYEYDQARMDDLRLAINRGSQGRPINSPERLGIDESGHRHPGAVRYIARIDPGGRSTLLYSLEEELKYPDRPPAADGDPYAFERRYRQLGDQIYVAFQIDYDAVLPGESEAVFEVGFDYRAYRNHLHKEALTYCYAILIVVAFMLIVFPLFFRATVTRPMQQLLSLLRKSESEGGSATGAGASEEDELTQLSRTFARMMGLLKEAKSRFYEYSEHIEEVERIVVSHGSGESILREVGGRNLLYASAAMREVIKQADRFATFDRPVLVTGETGTGKELIARLIHQAGPRAERPFVAVNCAAIPASLWESEIFGHVRGAFTDARSNRSGRVSEAENGTLFFDEIGEMPLEMQAKLLRLLQERVYHPVGGDESQMARCRFLFATNRDLLQMAEAGGFREDLYYRINVFQVNIPPLRERRADIPVLADHILKTICDEAGMPQIEAEPAAMNALVSYRWPGNIRELENTLMRSLAVSSQGHLQRGDLPPEVARAAKQNPTPVAGLTAAGDAVFAKSESSESNGSENARGTDAPFMPENQNFDDVVKGFSRRLIQEALHRSGGNKTRAAELLGMKRNRLRYQIKELNLED
ncbi:MAG: sigma-54 dependent transcriptional regulator [bacterium]|nr:sigma-54 dependent transcriptional regulator [bacterium]